MEILLLLGGAALLLLATQKKGGGASGVLDPKTIADLERLSSSGVLPQRVIADLERLAVRSPELARSEAERLIASAEQELVNRRQRTDPEDYRASLVKELQDRGWTGNTLLGSTREEIYENYIREFELFYGEPVYTNLNTVEAKRADLVKALRFRGWTGTTLEGSTIEEVYASFSRELDILLASETSTGPKFRVGDRVIADDGRNGIISTFHWNNHTEGYWYVVENDAFTWYQESRLRAA